MKAPACYTLKQKRVALQYKLFQYSQRIKDEGKNNYGCSSLNTEIFELLLFEDG